MSKFCVKCGKKLEDNAKFCDSCGSETDKEVVESVVINNVEAIQTEGSTNNGKANGLSIASMVLSIVSVFLFRTVCSILGIVFGAISYKKIKKTGQKGKGFAITGIVVGCVVLGIELIVLFFLSFALSAVATSFIL